MMVRSLLNGAASFMRAIFDKISWRAKSRFLQFSPRAICPCPAAHADGTFCTSVITVCSNAPQGKVRFDAKLFVHSRRTFSAHHTPHG
jgi:hypothetical protein